MHPFKCRPLQSSPEDKIKFKPGIAKKGFNKVNSGVNKKQKTYSEYLCQKKKRKLTQNTAPIRNSKKRFLLIPKQKKMGMSQLLFDIQREAILKASSTEHRYSTAPVLLKHEDATPQNPQLPKVVDSADVQRKKIIGEPYVNEKHEQK